jgi:hypothetical protein
VEVVVVERGPLTTAQIMVHTLPALHRFLVQMPHLPTPVVDLAVVVICLHPLTHLLPIKGFLGMVEQEGT